MKRRELIARASAALSVAGATFLPSTTAHASARRYRILVGGPPGDRLDRWGRACALGMQKGLTGGSAIDVTPAGGLDGVTAANRFQALIIPDGRTAALLPPEALIAFLVGDPRVHYQPGGWVPVLAGVSAPVLVLRGGTARLAHGGPIRFAASSLSSPDIAGLLALARLGVTATPVLGLRGMETVGRAFAAGEVDAALLAGEDIPADMGSLAAYDAKPICRIAAGPSGIGGEFAMTIKRALGDLPDVEELAASRHAPKLPGDLEAVYRAVAAASRLDFVLVLPHLASPEMIARWRSAAISAIRMPGMQAAALASVVTLLASTDAAAALSPIFLSSEALLSFRTYLVQRFAWRPS